MKGDCAICGGKRKKGTTTITVDKVTLLIVFRRVPAMVCDKCGEKWLDDETSEKLERLTNQLKDIGAEIEIIDFLTAA